MINQYGGSGRELVLVDGLGPADVVLVHREALCVLRSSMDTATSTPTATMPGSLRYGTRTNAR
ncbi:hypothetical protein [Streptomyces minutiscleroticus]|uniref:hypothetical protein n=1 Tax=Streptomyces minutiscleroticus TaxID=68238 RepID=UPI00167EAB85|nr:hypothetical protein [Streptomyces minutiscleroticus]